MKFSLFRRKERAYVQRQRFFFFAAVLLSSLIYTFESNLLEVIDKNLIMLFQKTKITVNS